MTSKLTGPPVKDLLIHTLMKDHTIMKDSIEHWEQFHDLLPINSLPIAIILRERSSVIIDRDDKP